MGKSFPNGSRRGKHPLANQRRREADPRVQAAKEETRRHNEELEARMAAEAANPAIGPTLGAHLKAALAASSQVEPVEEPKPEPVEKKAPKVDPFKTPLGTCFMCGGNIFYNGNYYCHDCEWGLPAREDGSMTKQEFDLFKTAYHKFMEVSGRLDEYIEPTWIPRPAPRKKAAPKVKAAPRKVRTAPKPEPEFDVSTLPAEGEGNQPFAVTSARMMLKAGYHIKHVIENTGVGYNDLSDLPIDRDGYGINEGDV